MNRCDGLQKTDLCGFLMKAKPFSAHLDAILASTPSLAAFVFSWSFSSLLSGHQMMKQGGIEISKEVIPVCSVNACNSLSNQIYLPSMFALNDLGKLSVQGYTCKRRGGDVTDTSGFLNFTASWTNH